MTKNRSNKNTMLANYFKLAVRNLRKTPGYSSINLAGLALGTACCLYILLYVRDQRGYDQHHRDGARTYRVVSDLSGIGDPLKTACVSPPIVPTMAQDFGEVEQWTRLVNPPELSHHVLRNGNRKFYETQGYFVDSTFFRVFDYHFSAGSPEKCLDEPYTVVLTAPVAEKLFGSAGNAIGQSLEIDNRYGKSSFRVTGVVDDSAGKSHIDGHFYMSMNSGAMGEFVRQNQSFGGQNFIYGYVKLFPNTQPSTLEAKLPDFMEKHGGDQLRSMGMQKVLHLEALADIHTRSDRRNQLTPSVSQNFLHLLMLLAVFVQAIACINFMNLSTARATRRAKEVGIRKAVGAGRGSLIGQFLGESLLLSALAIAAATPLVWFCLPNINQMTGADVQFAPLRDAGVWVMLAGLVAVTGLVAGSYPAFYLSGFEPVKVLKGVFSPGKNKAASGLRRGLVTVQFVIAIALIIGALVVQQQFNFLAHAELGFDRTQKIAVPFRTDDARAALGSFKQQLASLPEIQAVGSSVSKVGQASMRDFGIYTEGGSADKSQLLRVGVCDEDYLPALKIPLLYGRNFTPADTFNQLILNEKALASVGILPGEAVGKKVFSTFQGRTNTFEIIGVMRDFNFESLYQPIKPFGFLFSAAEENQYAMISFNVAKFAGVMPKIEAIWQKLVPGLPFEFTFQEDDLERQYASDKTLADIIAAFTFIALLISCLGLFGLATFAAEQRTKEIGIRKVLGASVASITSLLASDFLKLVLLAILLASPVAYYIMQQWLSDFAYHIDIQGWMFVAAGAVVVAIAFLTVSFQSIRAALMNPVKSLRSE